MKRKFNRKVAGRPVQYFYQNKFDGGLNSFMSDVRIKPSELSDCLNMEPGGNGIIKTRKGCKTFANSVGSRVRGLGWYKDSSGTSKLVRMSGTALRVYNTVTDQWDAVTGFTYTNDLDTDFCMANDKLFIQNNTDSLTYFNGSVVATQTNGQIGPAAIYFNGSLITFSGSRLYLSGTGTNIGDFSAGASGQFIDVQKNDGNSITAIHKYGTTVDNILLISKGKATYRLTFDSTGLPVIHTISATRGAVNHRSVDSMEDTNIMLTKLPAIMTQGTKQNFCDLS